MTALEREWAAKLKASGFQDLESADRDGPLSDRGNLHAVAETPEEDARLADRMAAGQARTEWMLGVLHTHRFRNATERTVWERHANGEPLRPIAAALGLSYDRTRKIVVGVKARVTQVRKVKQWRNPSRQRKTEIAMHVRRCDPRTLQQLAAVLMTGLIRKSCSSSSSR